MSLTVVFQFENSEKNREYSNEISERYIEDYEDRMSEPPVQLIDNKIFVDMNSPKLPEWIRAFREYHSWTQSELTKRSTVSLQYISQIERGTFSPAIGTVRKLLHTFLEAPRQIQLSDLIPEIPAYSDPVQSDIYELPTNIIDFRDIPKSPLDFQCIEDLIDDTLAQIKDTKDYGLLSLALLCLQHNLKLNDLREYKTTDALKENFINRYQHELSSAMMLLLKSKSK